MATPLHGGLVQEPSVRLFGEGKQQIEPAEQASCGWVCGHGLRKLIASGLKLGMEAAE